MMYSTRYGMVCGYQKKSNNDKLGVRVCKQRE